MIGITTAIAIILTVSYLFYESFFAAIFLSPYIILHMKKYKERLKNKRKETLAKEFSDVLQSVKSSLASGSSLENAFRDSGREIVMVYGKDCYMIKELTNIVNQLSVNIPLEVIMEDFGNRSQVEDIQLFSEILRYAKRSGGNIIGIITKTIDTISSKSSVKADIDTMISGKKYEQKIMNIMPFFIIVYLKISGGSMLDPLYGNLLGIIVMTICLLIYMAAIYLAEKILNIEV